MLFFFQLRGTASGLRVVNQILISFRHQFWTKSSNLDRLGAEINTSPSIDESAFDLVGEHEAIASRVVDDLLRVEIRQLIAEGLISSCSVDECVQCSLGHGDQGSAFNLLLRDYPSVAELAIAIFTCMMS